MKRMTAASSAIAAAALLSATALLGGGALAAEPSRLSAAQMDRVTAGTTTTLSQTMTSTTTVADGPVKTANEIVVENGVVTVKEEVLIRSADAAAAQPEAPAITIADGGVDVDALHAAIEARVGAIEARVAAVSAGLIEAATTDSNP